MTGRHSPVGVAAAGLAALLGDGCGSSPELTGRGRIREQFEHYTNREFGFDPPHSDSYVLQRVQLGGRAQWEEGLALDAELVSALALGKEGEISPLDEDRLGVQKAMVDWTPDTGLRLRGGRQELAFGRGRLVSYREGPNVRLAFDGLRFSEGDLAGDGSRLDVFGLAPVRSDTGVFDDDLSTDELFWGVHQRFAATDGPAFEVYYLGRARDGSRVVEAAGSVEIRHSFGARFDGRLGPFDADLEAVWQLGETDDVAIRAWTVSAVLEAPLTGTRLTPGIRLDAISGDEGPGDDVNQTFDALYPNNSYFNEAAIFAPANLLDANPNLRIDLTDDLRLFAMWDFLWRFSTDDAVYVPPGVASIPGAASDARFIGHSISLALTWELCPKWTFDAAFTHLEAGPVVRDGNGDDVDYFAMWVNWRF